MIMKIDLNQFEILKRIEGTTAFESVDEKEAELVRQQGIYPPATYNTGVKTLWLAVIKNDTIQWYRGKRKNNEPKN